MAGADMVTVHDGPLFLFVSLVLLLPIATTIIKVNFGCTGEWYLMCWALPYVGSQQCGGVNVIERTVKTHARVILVAAGCSLALLLATSLVRPTPFHRVVVFGTHVHSFVVFGIHSPNYIFTDSDWPASTTLILETLSLGSIKSSVELLHSVGEYFSILII